MWSDSYVTTCAHHAIISYKPTFLESKLFPLGSPIQRYFGPYQHVLQVLVPLVANQGRFREAAFHLRVFLNHHLVVFSHNFG